MLQKSIFWGLTILTVRIVLGYLSLWSYQQDRSIRLSGYPIYIYQYNTKQIYKIGRFFFESEKICALKEGEKMSVIGRIDKQVIEVLKGDLWLRDAKFDCRTFETKNRNESAIFPRTADYFRKLFLARFNFFVPSPEKGLIEGVLLGYKKDIGRDVYDVLVRSGSIHIAVASGFNVMLLGGAAMGLLFWLVNRRWATVISVLLMGVYAMIAGAEPPVVRAWIMASLIYFSQSVGRGVKSVTVLGLSVWVMLMMDPTLMANVSFQLSVAASLGLFWLYPMVAKLSTGRFAVLFGWLDSAGVLSSVAVTLLTTPIIWWQFGRLNYIGILSNILILPLVPPLMILGFGFLLWPWLLALPLTVLARLILRLAEFFAG